MTESSNPFSRMSAHWKTGLAAVALFAAGGAVGGVASRAFGPIAEMAPSQPVAINALATNSGIVTIRARVQEVYGNKFLAADPTGHALVDLGRAGDRSALVASGQTVTVQGRFDQGVLHASFLVDPSGIVRALGHDGMRGHDRDDRHGPMHDGPRGDRRDGPPPAPPVDQPPEGPTAPPVTAK